MSTSPVLSTLQLRLQQALTSALESDQPSFFTPSELKELKQIVDNHLTPQKQILKLKAQVSDYQFEVKKLTEDIASERTLMELQKIKVSKNYEQKIADLKDKFDHDNKDWISRFDLQTEEYKVELAKMKKVFDEESKKEIREFKQQIQMKMGEQIRENQETIEELKLKIVTIEKIHYEQKQHLIKESQEKLGQEIKAVHDSTNQLISKKQKEFQLSKSLIEHQRKQEEHKHQYTKKQFSGVKDNLYEQIYKLTTEKIDLEEQVKTLEYETEEKSKKIQALNESIKQLEISHEDRISKLVNSSKQTMENIKSKSTGDFKQIYDAQLIYIDTITTQIGNLEQKHQDCMKHHKLMIENLKKSHNERPSKSQDIDIIKMLKEKLWKKQKDLELSQEETIWYKRELENRDEMYTKLFNGGNSNNYVPYEAVRPRKESETVKTMPISPANNRLTSKSLGGRSLREKKKLEDIRVSGFDIEQPEAKNNYYLQVPKNYI